VGLIGREIERAGIATVGISIVRDYSVKVKPPRTVFLCWPFGHPLGEPFQSAQQRVVLAEALAAFCNIRQPGEIRDLAYRWRRERYGDKDIDRLLGPCRQAGRKAGHGKDKA
jgi:D-proline reductase (dithiol) PrdB